MALARKDGHPYLSFFSQSLTFSLTATQIPKRVTSRKNPGSNGGSPGNGWPY
jgi:hypothetical protein